jgi:hypothetical protein
VRGTILPSSSGSNSRRSMWQSSGICSLIWCTGASEDYPAGQDPPEPQCLFLRFQLLTGQRMHSNSPDLNKSTCGFETICSRLVRMFRNIQLSRFYELGRCLCGVRRHTKTTSNRSSCILSFFSARITLKCLISFL